MAHDANAKPKRVIALGDLVLDAIIQAHLPVQPMIHQTTHGMRLEPGGSGNFIVAARRLGMDVLAVGAVGADAFGETLRAMFAAEGVDQRGVFVAPGSTSAVVIDLVDPNTRQHVFLGTPGAGERAPYTSELDALVIASDAVFLQGYSLRELQHYGFAEALIERAQQAHVPVYFDTGPTIEGVPYERVRWFMQRTQVLFMTQDEVALAADGRTGADAVEYLLAHGLNALVIKRGAHGCDVHTVDGGCLESAGFGVPVVDTIGAGDCFDAGFIYGQLHGFTLPQTALLANAVGAANVQKSGAGRNAPTREEVCAVLRNAGIDSPFVC